MAVQQATRGPFVFPRDRRLTAADQYKRVFARPRRLEAGGFAVLVRASAAGRARLGLAIAKRVCPRALDRNRLKRIVRESFRTHCHLLPAVDIVVLATPQGRHLANRELFEGLARTWQKIGRNAWAVSSS